MFKTLNKSKAFLQDETRQEDTISLIIISSCVKRFKVLVKNPTTTQLKNFPWLTYFTCSAGCDCQSRNRKIEGSATGAKFPLNLWPRILRVSHIVKAGQMTSTSPNNTGRLDDP